MVVAGQAEGRLAAFLARWRDPLEDRLRAYAAPGADCPARLSEALTYALLAPGKRIRPMLVLMAAELCGADPTEALPAACAVEMIHTYSLVHDDLPAMDDDDLRRGRPTCHVVYGEANGILVGDALQAMAFQALSEDIPDGSVAARCVAALARAAGPSALVGGQFDDLSAESLPATMETLQAIHRRKTGALLTVSLELGGLVAGGTAEQLDSLRRYGAAIGLCFQITDDLLDATGSSEDVGKRTGKDTDKHKLTFANLIGIEASRDAARQWAGQACAALESFGERAGALVELAQFVLERDR
ncbi:MAG: polyprenyl synthetase family protein [Planctomycetales bacterium]|nr:polyprenyl synthetase family protein [Planctomycetales bacterium]